jgi:hypothetical protein
MTDLVTDILEGWTIFDHPVDYPDDYVARRWIAHRDHTVTHTDDILKHENLNTLRGMMGRVAPGLVCIGRYVEDDPKILEVWI